MSLYDVVAFKFSKMYESECWMRCGGFRMKLFANPFPGNKEHRRKSW